MEREHQIAADFLADEFGSCAIRKGAKPDTVMLLAGPDAEVRWVIDENGCVESHDGAHPDLLDAYIDLHEKIMWGDPL